MVYVMIYINVLANLMIADYVMVLDKILNVGMALSCVKNQIVL